MDVLLSLLICAILHNVGRCQFKIDSDVARKDHANIIRNVLSIYATHTTLTVIHDEASAAYVSLVSTLLRYRQKQMMFSYHQVHTVLIPLMEKLMKHASLEQMRDQLQFVVVCELSCVEYVFPKVRDLDMLYGQESLLRHFSTWLIVSPDDLQLLNTSFDNVAWIRLRTEGPRNAWTQESFPEMNTLLWMPGGRKWSNIHVNTTLSLSYHKVFPNSNDGLNGREIVLSTLEWTKYAIRKELPGKVTYTGIGIDSVDDLKRRFNFSYTIIEPQDNLWGQEIDNGVFTGVLGMLQRKEAHMCPVPYGITIQRKDMMDFSSPIGYMEYTIIYRRNSNINNTWLFLVSSYSWPVYVCGAVALLWVIFCMLILGHSQRKGINRNGDDHLEMDMYFDIAVRVPFRQDIQMVPTLISSRLMVFTWSLFCLMFAAVYTSNLVSRSAVNKHIAPFNNIEELAENVDYKIVTIEGLPIDTFLKDSNSSIHKKLYERLVVLRLRANETFDDAMDTILQQIISGTCVALATESIQSSLLSKNCNLSKMWFGLFSTSLGIGFPKYSPLRKLFDTQLLNMVDMGLYRQSIKKWSPKSIKCHLPVRLPQVATDHLKSGLITAGCGILIAVLVLLLETRHITGWNKTKTTLQLAHTKSS